jgi:hypothetical protein
MTAFEDGLWSRLVDEHGADRVSLPPQRTRRTTPSLIGGGAIAAAAAAAAIAMSVLGGSAPAYALTRNANGTITLSIYQWSRVDIRQIDARFAGMGSRWRFVPVTASCATPWPPKDKDWGYEIVSTTANGAKSGSVTPGPTSPAFPGVWVIAAGQRADGSVAIATVTMPGPLPECLPAAALSPPS